MDPKHTGDIVKHLEKQNELLNQSHSSISYELHKLQVEEEMLMRKLYELMKAIRQHEKNENKDEISDKKETGQK